MFGGIVQGGDQPGLCKAKLESAELAREKTDDVNGFWWRDQDAVDAVDDTVCAKLLLVSTALNISVAGAYNVDSNNAAIEVDRQASKTDIGAQSLLLEANVFAFQ